MSTTTTTQSATCSYCDDEHDIAAAVEGSYCSTECFHRAKGAAAIGELEKNHTICGTCYSVRKEIERPSEAWINAHGELAASAFIGIEHPTAHLRRSDGLLYCECGAVEHDASHEFIKVLVLYETATNLYKRLQELYEQDKLAHPPDGVVLMRALRDSRCDWELAAGRAIYARES